MHRTIRRAVAVLAAAVVTTGVACSPDSSHFTDVEERLVKAALLADQDTIDWDDMARACELAPEKGLRDAALWYERRHDEVARHDVYRALEQGCP